MAVNKAKVIKQVRAHCPKCGPDRIAHVMANHVETGGDETVTAWSDYRILRCPACETIQLQIASSFSEDYDYDEDANGAPILRYNESYSYWPPLAQRRKPEWLNSIENQDPLLGSILTEVYHALDNNMPIAAATTMRTAFDQVTKLLKIDPAITFGEKLQELVQRGEVAAKDREVLEPLVEAGNAAAHRGWTPTAEQLTTMVLILEALVHRTLILNKKAKALKKHTPARPKRRNRKKQ